MPPIRTTKSGRASRPPSTATNSSKPASTPTQPRSKPAPKTQIKSRLPPRMPKPPAATSTPARPPLKPILKQAPVLTFLPERQDTDETGVETGFGEEELEVGMEEGVEENEQNEEDEACAQFEKASSQVQAEWKSSASQANKDNNQLIIDTLERVGALNDQNAADLDDDELGAIEHCEKLLHKANSQYDQIIAAIDSTAVELAPAKAKPLGDVYKKLQNRGPETRERHREFVSQFNRIKAKKAQQAQRQQKEADKLVACLGAMLRI